ncbi:hypothetical protein DO021_21515 [Desulfobacter hydrogenophilus]|uniref:HTH cro/C1-type domain-containing protein n=1 Tax=Desulfobacter hydrogenophilus TaxID=2291 RepID=A0A328FAB6_9BACT|nr:AAA family ATPase [Desulfobacter hydrogenophilus]NDY74464.1 AAA family ATPase [Desulfobacter hydrogenophilus]QBH14301.1 hypothetical protein EYB58_16090 [Desulfobacter hydrogenophilus]RAL99976.1 hypothetical protein DO021_21515 [Desulfobacter hydrogenophilus]
MSVLKQLLIELDIPQREFAVMMGTSKNTLSRILQGRMPVYQKSREKTIGPIMAWVSKNKTAMAWLKARNYGVSDIWLPFEGQGKKKVAWSAPIGLGDPNEIEPREDIEMITRNALRYFKMFNDPFFNDVNSSKDIFMSGEHRFLREMMLDAAQYGGFVAIVGGVGSGKSVMRKVAVEQLMQEGVKIVFPLIIDKSRVSPASLIDAIVMDISDEPPKRSLEQKTRQAMRLLKARAESGMKQVLMIEESQMIDKRAFKALKQIHELENGFSRLIGIILIGQPELLKKLDEVSNPDIREVTRRITTAEIQGLGEDVAAYLRHKFTRTGKNVDDILAEDVYPAINQKLSRTRGRKTIDKSYPLSVNNLVARAINLAADMGEEKVSADLVMTC